MLTKIKLFYQIKKFYNIFGEVLGSNFIHKLSDITTDNLNDVLFDIHEALEMYDNAKDPMVIWLKKLYRSIRNYRETKPQILLNITSTISVLLMLWVFFSTIEVNAKNLTPNPQYSDANFFILLTGGDN
jgi:hypothetical protein